MEKLREWLDLTNVTQTQLAADLGVTRQTVNNWISGRTEPSGTELRRIHEVTRLSLDDLVPKSAA